MREAHRSFCATGQKNRKIDPRARSKPAGAALALRRLTRRVLEHLRGGPGTLLDDSWPLLALPGRPKIALKPARAHLGRVPNASRRVPETALNTQNHPRTNFRRFFIDLAWFFFDFRSIFPQFRRPLLLFLLLMVLLLLVCFCSSVPAFGITLHCPA